MKIGGCSLQWWNDTTLPEVSCVLLTWHTEKLYNKWDLLIVLYNVYICTTTHMYNRYSKVTVSCFSFSRTRGRAQQKKRTEEVDWKGKRSVSKSFLLWLPHVRKVCVSTCSQCCHQGTVELSYQGPNMGRAHTKPRIKALFFTCNVGIWHY